jgi:hypothetical protein
MVKLNPNGAGAANSAIVTLRCPSCHRLGSFDGYHSVNDIVTHVPVRGADGQSRAAPCRSGIRICPNPECREIVFITADETAKLLTYPPERIDFEATDIPTKILASFEEAVADHANRCYRSAAIMVRRTLEEICADRSATGPNLKARLQSLGSVIIVPKALLAAADELRLLGNDAAHLEAQIYDDIGKEEVEAAVALVKEILKAVYQLSSLVEQLRKLKK